MGLQWQCARSLSLSHTHTHTHTHHTHTHTHHTHTHTHTTTTTACTEITNTANKNKKLPERNHNRPPPKRHWSRFLVFRPSFHSALYCRLIFSTLPVGFKKKLPIKLCVRFAPTKVILNSNYLVKLCAR